MGWRAMVLAVLMQTVSAAGQPAVPAQATGRGTVSGILLGVHVQVDSDFEISLMSDGGLVIDQIRTPTNQRFSFSRLPVGVYYLVVDAPEFKSIRQRVDLRHVDFEVSASILLERQEQIVVVKREDLSGETDATIHVAQLAQPAWVQKDFADAARKLESGNIDAARARLESLVIEAPEFYDAHQSLGNAYQLSKRYRDAEKEYRIARDLRPNSAAPLISLASLYLEQVEPGSTQAEALLNDAHEVLLRAVQINPGAAFGHYLLGVTHYRAGRYSDAQTSLVLALELEPKLGSARLALANVHIRAHEWSAALTQLDAYLKENPDAAGREQVQAKRAQVEAVNLRKPAAVSR